MIVSSWVELWSASRSLSLCYSGCFILGLGFVGGRIGMQVFRLERKECVQLLRISRTTG